MNSDHNLSGNFFNGTEESGKGSEPALSPSKGRAKVGEHTQIRWRLFAIMPKIYESVRYLYANESSSIVVSCSLDVYDYFVTRIFFYQKMQCSYLLLLIGLNNVLICHTKVLSVIKNIEMKIKGLKL